MAAPQTLYLIDGTAQLYRAYFAITGLTNAEGMSTNAVYGFTTMLRKLLRDEGAERVGVAFDVKGPVFRHEVFPEYKANRPPTPDDLRAQVPYAKEVCESLNSGDDVRCCIESICDDDFSPAIDCLTGIIQDVFTPVG